jgi:hypothetical protein
MACSSAVNNASRRLLGDWGPDDPGGPLTINRVLTIATVILAVVLGCRAEKQRQWKEEAPPTLIVTLQPGAAKAIQTDSLRRIAAPPVEFMALAGPNGNHRVPIIASALGRIVDLRARDSVNVGDTVATLSALGDKRIALLAGARGVWRASKGLQEEVWRGDTVGMIEVADYGRADGSVNADESQDVHIGDPARVKLAGDPDTSIAAVVEYVGSSIRTLHLHTSIGVGFKHPQNPDHRGVAAVVTVMPAGPSDSVFAVPDKAIVRLPDGLAIFLPKGDREYEVRLVSIQHDMNGLVVLREGINRKTKVVIGGLDALRQAAEDSIRQRTLRN